MTKLFKFKAPLRPQVRKSNSIYQTENFYLTENHAVHGHYAYSRAWADSLKDKTLRKLTEKIILSAVTSKLSGEEVTPAPEWRLAALFLSKDEIIENYRKVNPLDLMFELVPMHDNAVNLVLNSGKPDIFVTCVNISYFGLAFLDPDSSLWLHKTDENKAVIITDKQGECVALFMPVRR